MHIAIPIHAFEPGGVERVGLRLAEQWHAEGHKVSVILGRDRGACREERPSLAYHGYREPFETAGWETIWMMICLLRFLLRERPDVIFCAGLTYTAPCVLARLMLGKRCPPVVVKVSNDLDRSDIRGVLRGPYELWLWLQGIVLDHFVAIGEPMREPTIAALGVTGDRVNTIPDPALSVQQLQDLVPAPKVAGARKHILAIGRLVHQKNFALLLEAFAQLPKEDVTLTIAGEGPLRDALERKVEGLGLTSRVAMPGHVENITELMHSADILTVSSDFEGVPAVVIEALAARLPVAATDCCASMQWLLGDGAFGALARRGDATNLSRVMTNALAMKPDKTSMKAFAANFTLERASGDYLNLLARTARRQSKKNGET